MAFVCALIVPSLTPRKPAMSCVEKPLIAKRATSRSAAVRTPILETLGQDIAEGASCAAKRLLGRDGAAARLAQGKPADHDADDEAEGRADLDQFDEGPVDGADRQAQDRDEDIGNEEGGAGKLDRKHHAEDVAVVHTRRSAPRGMSVLAGIRRARSAVVVVVVVAIIVVIVVVVVVVGIIIVIEIIIVIKIIVVIAASLAGGAARRLPG